MFNIGDLVYQKRAEISFGLGVILEIADRTAGPEQPNGVGISNSFCQREKTRLQQFDSKSLVIGTRYRIS